MKSENKGSLTSWIVLLLSFGTAIGLVVYIAHHQAAVKNLIQGLGAAGPLVSILLYAILAVSPVPADPLNLINGAVYGPIWGGLIAWIGMTLAALVEYFVGRRIGDAAEFERKRQDLPFGLGNLPVDSILFLLGGRMLTGLGSKAVSYLCGIYRISLWRYIWTASVSTLFNAFMFALGGAGLLNFLQ
jgi:uncharacterized membrane protein YdjX (TVP38/TMEM64 family)